jgi:hypothetical protein
MVEMSLCGYDPWVAGDVFISYSRVDQDYVDALAAHLQQRGIAVWYDQTMGAADRFEQLIEKRIDDCSAFVVVMSPETRSSSWVSVEISHASLRRKPILPLLLRGDPFFNSRYWTTRMSGTAGSRPTRSSHG